MYKILYAASNNLNALIQLERFYKIISKNKNIEIKIAAYKKSSPPNLNIDWTLDCLLEFFKNKINLHNHNCQLYLDRIKEFNPDLIISDLEIYTSYIGNILNIPVWQCSPLLLYYALSSKDKINSGLEKHLRHFLMSELQNHLILEIINNSERNYVYCHLGDLKFSYDLKENFNWIRPYHKIGLISIPCQHNIVSSLLESNKTILSLMKNQDDCVLFSNFEEQYNFIKKSLNMEQEYYCNLRNCNLFLCEGQMSFLADAFYNNKYCLVAPNFKDIECIFSSTLNQHLGYSKNIFNSNENINNYMKNEVIFKLDKNILYLHEQIEKYIGEKYE